MTADTRGKHSHPVERATGFSNLRHESSPRRCARNCRHRVMPAELAEGDATRPQQRRRSDAEAGD